MRWQIRSPWERAGALFRACVRRERSAIVREAGWRNVNKGLRRLDAALRGELWDEREVRAFAAAAGVATQVDAALAVDLELERQPIAAWDAWASEPIDPKCFPRVPLLVSGAEPTFPEGPARDEKVACARERARRDGIPAIMPAFPGLLLRAVRPARGPPRLRRPARDAPAGGHRGHLQDLAASLSTREKQSLEQIGDRFVYLPDWGVKSHARRQDVLDGLLTGTLLRLRVSCRYSLPDGSTFDGFLHPYALVLYKHGLYVVGASMRPVRGEPRRLEPQSPRIYAVERFSRAQYDRNHPFEVPADFDVERFFDGVFGIFVGGEPQHVVVDFAASARRLVEARRWHPTQELRVRKSGSIRLEMDVSNLTEVVPWIMSWGPLARVRGPPGLVRRIADEHRAAARHDSASAR